jgi:hypothetical protein
MAKYVSPLLNKQVDKTFTEYHPRAFCNGESYVMLW